MRKLLLVMALALLQSLAFADEAGAPAGRVKRLQGTASVERAGAILPLAVGTPVYAGDRIRTAADASIGVTLSDDTLLAAGPRSMLLINEFQFNPTTRGGNMLATLQKGAFSVVTGQLAKQSPQNVRFRTPSVVLGIRGTEFIVEVWPIEGESE